MVTIRELTIKEAEAMVEGARLDRRRSYATDGYDLLQLSKWTDVCYGCASGPSEDRVGSGCHECGYTGKRRHALWTPCVGAVFK